MPNRLSRERSPYLLQHANNPVDWYPWGDEAFQRARAEDKPIFLSVGYSTCHWCHVMEHESFESGAIADILNGDFVAIKVDREERPDVDRVYMTFVQATTGAGGWPMSVWLTTELKPFFGGTYFPPDARWGRPGFAEILREIARVWRDERDRVLSSADTLTTQLRETAARSTNRGRSGKEIAPAATLADGVRQFTAVFDSRHGGFGGAPKFPRPSELLFLLRASSGQQTAQDEQARGMALETLRAMAIGGMRDHIGGGFHRYAVDAAWRVPHFEKMLYDQAQLTIAYLEGAQASGESFYAAVAEDTLAYVRRDLTAPEGGFYSAEDADSVPPEQVNDPSARKSEGAFYIWRWREVEEVLGEDAAIARLRFGLENDGNAPHDPQGEFTHRNLLYTEHSMEDVARLSGRTADQVSAALGRARQGLFEARAHRPRPHLDDKILTAWNGLMIAAFARGARVLEGNDGGAAHLESARRAARFIQDRMWDAASGRLLRRYRDGEAAIDGYAEDFAYLIWGLLELFQASGERGWLEWALALQRRQDELFWDPIEGGWFSTTGHDPTVLLRLKEDYDGAEPAASSVAVINLLTIAHLTGEAGAVERIELTLARFGDRIGAAARSIPMMMCGLAAYHAGSTQVVIVGPAGQEDTRALWRTTHARYLPFAIAFPLDPGAAALHALLPWTAAMTMRRSAPTAYVCRDFACREPITAPAELARALA